MVLAAGLASAAPPVATRQATMRQVQGGSYVDSIVGGSGAAPSPPPSSPDAEAVRARLSKCCVLHHVLVSAVAFACINTLIHWSAGVVI